MRKKKESGEKDVQFIESASGFKSLLFFSFQSHRLVQGSQTRGPRATCYPLDAFVQLNNTDILWALIKFNLFWYFLLTVAKKKLFFIQLRLDNIFLWNAALYSDPVPIVSSFFCTCGSHMAVLAVKVLSKVIRQFCAAIFSMPSYVKHVNTPSGGQI